MSDAVAKAGEERPFFCPQCETTVFVPIGSSVPRHICGRQMRPAWDEVDVEAPAPDDTSADVVNPVAAVRCVQWLSRNLSMDDPVPEIALEDNGSIGLTLRRGRRTLSVGFDDDPDPPHEDHDYMTVGFGPAATVRDAIRSLTKTPRRRHEITLTVSGDLLTDVGRELYHVGDVVFNMKEPTVTNSVGGGPSSGHAVLEHHFDADQTHERYFEQVEAWKTQRDAAPTNPQIELSSAAKRVSKGG